MTALHPIYKSLVAEWERDLEATERAIFQVLYRAMPDGRTRRQLVWDVFGVIIPENADINNNTYDRKIRKTIEAMREKMIPVFSSSAESGYRLEVSESAISRMVAECENRLQVYADKVRRGRQLQTRIRELGERAIREPESGPRQIGLFG
jgi:hypothetical protein